MDADGIGCALDGEAALDEFENVDQDLVGKTTEGCICVRQ
jgi:hypothetical protein